MPRMAAVVIPDCPHHLTQRGNRRDGAFFTEADRARYLDLLGQYADTHGLAIHVLPHGQSRASGGRGLPLVERPGPLPPAADAMLANPCELTARLRPEKRRQWLRDPWDAEPGMTARLRHCTHTGRPAGGTDFIARLEALVGRVLRAKTVGRTKKPKTDKGPHHANK